MESEKNFQEVGIIYVIIYINLPGWLKKSPPNFMIEHLLRDLYGVDSSAVKYIVNVKKSLNYTTLILSVAET